MIKKIVRFSLRRLQIRAELRDLEAFAEQLIAPLREEEQQAFFAGDSQRSNALLSRIGEIRTWEAGSAFQVLRAYAQ